jgi:large subunit ribosomal protein L21
MARAVIRTGGKQFVVTEGETLRVPSLATEPGGAVELEALVAIGEEANVGTPAVAGVKVSATVVAHGRGAKVIVFKKKRRKHYKRKQGHRQGFTTLRIDSIG